MNAEIQFTDTHAHLPMLKHAPIADILERAREVGVSRMITVATDETNWAPSRDLAALHPHLHYTLGVHPHEAKDWSETRSKLEALFPDAKVPPKCVAIGEMGLDYHYEFSDPQSQLQAFKDQLRLAKRLGLPVVVHCREAFADLFSAIKEIGTADRPGVMHCFTGTHDEAKASLDLGFKISFSGILTFKNAADLRETAKRLPLSEILVETDCPYLAPLPHRGKPNEPSYLPLTAGTLAAVRGVPIEDIALQTTENAVEFFRLR